MTELNQTKASRLKHTLSDWREVVLQANSLLTWDQEWYPGVIAALVTAFYTAIWYWDPTLVTFIAFLGLFATMLDYLGPKVINQVFSVDQWSSVKERKFDEVCENVVLGIDKLDSLWQFCREARTQKPVFHFIGTLFFFFSLAAIGNRMNNFFLAYIMTNAVFMLPGLHKKGILKEHFAKLTLRAKDYMKKAE